MTAQVKSTGVLRGDIKLLHGDTLMLFDPAADAYYKVSERLAQIISFFSEDLPLPEMAEKLHRHGINAEIEEIHEICLFLRQNGLLIPQYGETEKRRVLQESLKKKTLLLRISSAYLFFRFPPIRPEKFFNTIAPLVSVLTSRRMILLWLLPALFGYLLALRDSGKIAEQFLHSLSWMGLVKYVLAIVLVKIVHEMAHSLAAIHFRCRVRGIGLGFIFFVPRLYTDTTDSWRLPAKQRLVIDGAGILAELIIGGLAVLLWHLSPPGAWQATMFYIFAVSTLSTLLVNGNIFIRYDGYYILSDLLKIENLMKRSAECVRQTWRWHFLRLGTPSGEKRKVLLISYGIGAFIYRIFLYTSICLLIYYKFIKALAVLLLALEIYALLLYPLMTEIKTIWKLSRQSTGKAVWLMLSAVILLLSGLLFVPWSWGMTLPGETAPARRSPVSVTESGYLMNPLTDQCIKVEAGTIIAELSVPHLDLAKEKVRRTAEYDRRLFSLQELDEQEFARSVVTAQKIRSDELALQELLRREANRVIKADRPGYFVPAQGELSAGAFLKSNTQIGEIVSRQNTVYAYANDQQVGKVYPGQKGSVRFPDALQKIPCRVKRIDQVAARLKNSPVLQIYGGPETAYQVSPEEFSTEQTLYRIELDIPENEMISGRLVKVKLSHSDRLYTHIRKMLLSFFRKEF